MQNHSSSYLVATPAGGVTVDFGEASGVTCQGQPEAIEYLRSGVYGLTGAEGFTLTLDTLEPNDLVDFCQATAGIFVLPPDQHFFDPMSFFPDPRRVAVLDSAPFALTKARQAMAAAIGAQQKLSAAKEIMRQRDLYAPMTAERYAPIWANGGNINLQLANRDRLDALFQERVISVRNELRTLGWDGPRFGDLSKAGVALEIDAEQVGAGRNIVGVVWGVGASRVRDDLTKTPQELAAIVDGLAVPSSAGAPTAADRRRVAGLASAVDLGSLADQAMAAKTAEELAAVEAEIARQRPASLVAINEERRALGDLAVAQSVGLGQAEVDDFANGTNTTGINPNGWGQDGLAMEVAQRRKAKLAAPSENTIAAQGRDNAVKTAKGTKVLTGFAVIEGARLIVSHDAQGNPNPEYPMELQPRDRARATSQAWVLKTAANLDPDSLGRTTRADSGAPIVGPDRVVESGNGRTMAILEAYRTGKADEYRAWLEQEAAYFGIDPEKVKTMKAPVLVRVRKSDVDRRAFAVEANQDDKLAMTATERARADARRLDDALMARLSADGELAAAGNREFLRGFLVSLGDAEAAQYITSDGQPTASLVARVQAAIFAKAYADDRLLELTADASKPEIANIIQALNAAAPEFVRAMGANRTGTEEVAQGLTDGVEASLNQQAVQAIIDATNVVKKAKADGLQVADVVAQQGLFGDMDPAVAAMAMFIANNNRSAKRLATAFTAMAAFITSESQKAQTMDMFGGGGALSLADVVAAANREMDKQYGEGAYAIEQFGLFGAKPAEPTPVEPQATEPTTTTEPEPEPAPEPAQVDEKRAADMAVLQQVVDGQRPNLLATETADELERIAMAYETDAEVQALFEQALAVYEAAALKAAATLN